MLLLKMSAKIHSRTKYKFKSNKYKYELNKYNFEFNKYKAIFCSKLANEPWRRVLPCLSALLSPWNCGHK